MTMTMTMTEMKQVGAPSAFGDFCAGFAAGVIACAAAIAALAA